MEQGKAAFPSCVSIQRRNVETAIGGKQESVKTIIFTFRATSQDINFGFHVQAVELEEN